MTKWSKGEMKNKINADLLKYLDKSAFYTLVYATDMRKAVKGTSSKKQGENRKPPADERHMTPFL